MYFWRFSITWKKDCFIGLFNDKIFDNCGISLGMLKLAFWYDDTPEGLK